MNNHKEKTWSTSAVRHIYILRLPVNSDRAKLASVERWKWISKNDPDSVVAKNVSVNGIGDSNSPPEACALPRRYPSSWDRSGPQI